jgi:hypothetical protein
LIARLKRHRADLLPFTRAILFAGLWLLTTTTGFASTSTNVAPSEPKLVTGTIYESGSDQKKILFTFRRTATNSGPMLHVQCKYIRPDGFVAAVENVVYRTNQLVSYHLNEFQAGVWGDISVSPDPKKPGQKRIFINYCHAQDAGKKNGQILKPDTLIGDQIYPFILDHWNALMHGDSVKFNFVSLDWQTTFGFQLVKQSEMTLHGVPMVRIKMEPTSFFIAPLVSPMYFIIEKNGAHRLAEYIGRITPRIKKRNSWKTLDADLVVDWK